VIPPWVRWIEVAQFPESVDADHVRDWLEREQIQTRVRPHRGEPRGNIGTSVGYQILPDRAPVPHRYTVEVRRHELERAHAVLAREGWNYEGYETHWWLLQSVILGGLVLTAVIVIGVAAIIARQ
jgi:hypothetical protein